MPIFKVGDRVRMSAEGRRRWGDSSTNPNDLIGEIISIEVGDDFDLPIIVRWSNSRSNSYAEDHLERVGAGINEVPKVPNTDDKILAEIERFPWSDFPFYNKKSCELQLLDMMLEARSSKEPFCVIIKYPFVVIKKDCKISFFFYKYISGDIEDKDEVKVKPTRMLDFDD